MKRELSDFLRVPSLGKNLSSLPLPLGNPLAGVPGPLILWGSPSGALDHLSPDCDKRKKETSILFSPLFLEVCVNTTSLTHHL